MTLETADFPIFQRYMIRRRGAERGEGSGERGEGWERGEARGERGEE